MKILYTILFSFFTSICFSADLYVDGDFGGSTTAGCEASANPCKTIEAADTAASGGDTVHVKGTFGSQQNVENGGSHSGAASDYPGSWTSPVTYQPWTDADVNFAGGYSGIRFDTTASYVIFNGFYGANRRFRFYNTSQATTMSGSSVDHIQITGSEFGVAGQNPCGNGSAVKGGATYIYLNDNYYHDNNTSEHIYLGYYNAETCPPCYDEADYIYMYDNEFNCGPGSPSNDTNCVDMKSMHGVNEVKFYDNTVVSTMDSHYSSFQIGGGVEIYGNTFDITGQTGTARAAFHFWQGQGEEGVNFDVYVYRNIFIGNSGDESYVMSHTSTYDEASVYFYNNIVKGFTSASGGDFIECEGSDRPDALYVYHNTFFGNTYMDFDNGSCNTTFTVNVKNNIWDTWNDYAVMDGSNQTSTWDGNYYYKSGEASNVNNFTWNGTARSFDYIVATASQEANGNFGNDPNLDANGKIQASLTVDPAVDAADDMSGWPNYNIDIDGDTRPVSQDDWDIGPYEFEGEGEVVGNVGVSIN